MSMCMLLMAERRDEVDEFVSVPTVSDVVFASASTFVGAQRPPISAVVFAELGCPRAVGTITVCALRFVPAITRGSFFEACAAAERELRHNTSRHRTDGRVRHGRPQQVSVKLSHAYPRRLTAAGVRLARRCTDEELPTSVNRCRAMLGNGQSDTIRCRRDVSNE